MTWISETRSSSGVVDGVVASSAKRERLPVAAAAQRVELFVEGVGAPIVHVRVDDEVTREPVRRDAETDTTVREFVDECPLRGDPDRVAEGQQDAAGTKLGVFGRDAERRRGIVHPPRRLSSRLVQPSGLRPSGGNERCKTHDRRWSRSWGLVTATTPPGSRRGVLSPVFVEFRGAGKRGGVTTVRVEPHARPD